MTPEDFKKARRKLGLSVSELGGILNTRPDTIRKWESEKRADRSVNPVAARVVAWLEAGFRPPEWPDRKALPESTRES